MPGIRGASHVPCHCNTHNGDLIHYKQAQRCATASAIASFNELQRLVDSDSVSSESDVESGPDDGGEIRVTRRTHYVFEDEIDVLCFKLYANHVLDNSSEDSVTTNLQTIFSTFGDYLPRRLRCKLPTTYKQLAGRFTRYLPRLIRLPVCPGDCQILDGTRPSVHYVCWCNGKRNVAWR